MNISPREVYFFHPRLLLICHLSMGVKLIFWTESANLGLTSKTFKRFVESIRKFHPILKRSNDPKMVSKTMKYFMFLIFFKSIIYFNRRYFYYIVLCLGTTSADSFGLYIQAFCTGLDQVLDSYRKSLIDLEKQVIGFSHTWLLLIPLCFIVFFKWISQSSVLEICDNHYVLFCYYNRFLKILSCHWLLSNTA